MMELVNDLYAFGDWDRARPQSVAVVREADRSAAFVCCRHLRPTCARSCGRCSAIATDWLAATWPEFNADVAKAR